MDSNNSHSRSREAEAPGMTAPHGLNRNDKVNWLAMRREIETERKARERAELEVAVLRRQLKQTEDVRRVGGQEEVLQRLVARLEAFEKRIAPVPKPLELSREEPSDILHGYAEIGTFLRMTASQAEHRARSGEIPFFKLGRIVCARRSTLNAWLAEQESKAAELIMEAHRG